MVQVEVLVVAERVVVEYVQIRQFLQQSDLVQFNCISLNVRMPEIGRLIRLKVTKLFQEPRYLHNDPENILVRRMIVHRKPLHSLIVLNHRIKPLLLQLLPVLAQLVLIVVVEHQQKILNVRYRLFQLEVTLCGEQVVSQLLQLTDAVLRAFKRKRQGFMEGHCEVGGVGCCAV